MILYATEILKDFISRHQSLFKMHDLNINVDNVDDGYPKNAFAYICMDKIKNTKTKPIPFKKGANIELWCYAAVNNGSPCFSLAIEISHEDSCCISQKIF